jgi:hypothetical protein
MIISSIEHDVYRDDTGTSSTGETKTGATVGSDEKRAGPRDDDLKSPFRRAASTPDSPRHAYATTH